MLVGIVGKPSCGKSTFFSALTLIDVPTASYPFTTIEANKGVGFVKAECAEKFFDVECNPRHGYCIEGNRFIPVELIDVAGLVPGAHEGKGLGNKFLDDLRKADVLIHVVDASGSTDAEGKALPLGSHDPVKDILFLEEEIDLWFFSILKNNWNKFSKHPADSKRKVIDLFAQGLSGLGMKDWHIDKALNELNLIEKKLRDWNEEEIKNFAVKLREISKPIVIAANKIDLSSSEENIKRMKEKFPEKKIIPCSSESELALKKAAKQGAIKYIPGENDFRILKELNEKQKSGLELIKEKVLKELNGTGVQKTLNKAVFEELGYIVIFPGGVNKLADSEGNILPDAFLLPKGSTALDFAFKLHTDIGNNFVKAVNVKTKKLVGKDYVLENGDVIEIIFNK